MENVLEITVEQKQTKIIRVDGEDYSLKFPLPVVAALEIKLGRPMKSTLDWIRIRSEEVPPILEAALSTEHPDEAKDITAAICSALNPEEIGTVIDGLCAAACPKAMALLQAEIEKAQGAPFSTAQGTN